MNSSFRDNPGQPPERSGDPLRRLLVSALLVGLAAVVFFWITPYIAADTQPFEPTPSPTATLEPSLTASVTPTFTVTPTFSGTPSATPTPYAGFTAGSLDQMELDITKLRGWTNADWALFHSSQRLDAFIADPQLMAAVQALKPVSAKMQLFVQTGGVCTQPYCQVSWVGIVFKSPEDAYRAFELFNVVYIVSAPELDLAYNYAGATPAANAGATPDPNEKGMATSFSFYWKNMFIRISTLSQFSPSIEDIDQSYALVHEIFASWGQQSLP